MVHELSQHTSHLDFEAEVVCTNVLPSFQMSCVGHHFHISRLQAEELLLEADKDGSYLIRDSESVKASVLCLL